MQHARATANKNGAACSPRGGAGKAYTIKLECGVAFDDCPDPEPDMPMVYINAEVAITIAAESRECASGDDRPRLASGDYAGGAAVANAPMFAVGRGVVSATEADDAAECALYNERTTKAILGGKLALSSVVLDGGGAREGIRAVAATELALSNTDIINMVAAVGAGVNALDTPISVAGGAFLGNTAENGAAIAFASAYLPKPSLIASKGVGFQANAAAIGAAIYYTSVPADLKFSPDVAIACTGRCEFADNAAADDAFGGLVSTYRGFSDASNAGYRQRAGLSIKLPGASFVGEGAVGLGAPRGRRLSWPWRRRRPGRGEGAPRARSAG